MHKESFYQFILYILLKEGKGNIPFRTEAFLVGKQRASRRWFSLLFKGCDIPSFLYMKDSFERAYPLYPLDIHLDSIKKDELGLMTGECCFD